MSRPDSIQGDLTGGSVAAVLSLPESMAFGAIVFSAIRPEYLSMGVVAGLVALSVSNLIGALIGGVRIMNTGPYALACLMLASAVALLMSRHPELNENPELAILALLVLVLLAGLIQMLFGALKIGNLAKYIPYPVIAGLMNGLAILILLGQIRPMLGLAGDAPLAWKAVTDSIQPLTLVVGAITVATVFFCRHRETRIPAPVAGILLGSGCYYLIAAVLPGQPLGATVGTIPWAIPMPKYTLDLVRFLGSERMLSMLTSMLAMSFGIAIVASLRTLLGVVAVDKMTRDRSDSNRELIGQGIANMVGSLFGAVTVAGYSGQPIANYTYGGRTRFARFTVGLFALAVLLLLGPVVGGIPNVVLAGLLITIAWGSADRWSFGLLRRLFLAGKPSTHLVVDLTLVGTVTGVMVFAGLFEGVAIGIGASIFTFLYRMSKDTIRRAYDARRVRSNVERGAQEITLLEEHGHAIRIFELEGSLFFGTTDKLAETVERIDDDEMQFLIVDFKRVSDIDSTGANILLQTRDRLAERNVSLLISSIDASRGVGRELKQMAFFNAFDSRFCFGELDLAVGYAEDFVLENVLDSDRYQQDLDLAQVDAVKDLTSEELETLERHLRRVEYADGDIIHEQDTPGDGFFLLTRGRIDLLAASRAQDDVSKKFLATLCPGTVCGEMAVLDGRPRSATAVAKGCVVTWQLYASNLDKLRDEAPAVAYQLMVGLGRELAKRMRIANRLNTELRT